MLCFRKFPAAKNSMDERGGYKEFPTKNFCLTTPKTFARKLFVLCFTKVPVAKKIMHKRGVIRFSVDKILSRNAENFRKRTICVVFQKTSVSEKDFG